MMKVVMKKPVAVGKKPVIAVPSPHRASDRTAKVCSRQTK
jgi:hypothetical protein